MELRKSKFQNWFFPFMILAFTKSHQVTSQAEDYTLLLILYDYDAKLNRNRKREVIFTLLLLRAQEWLHKWSVSHSPVSKNVLLICY